ncbi:hypothetical protein [Sedimentimonas flavescens]|uniref:hypothetical protein n=1 Tax=Sedimentimonas flavescens TaxID=2851012 RepID=UPI001C4A6E69|nr:hypothetical protein [Sedimentimonas flavescens]MBW0159179.1 hypothetical protein [Sedimentimonas flavescens]
MIAVERRKPNADNIRTPKKNELPLKTTFKQKAGTVQTTCPEPASAEFFRRPTDAAAPQPASCAKNRRNLTNAHKTAKTTVGR